MDSFTLFEAFPSFSGALLGHRPCARPLATTLQRPSPFPLLQWRMCDRPGRRKGLLDPWPRHMMCPMQSLSKKGQVPLLDLLLEFI